eukprot:COSAG04_NODE_254_length_18809_cov_8.025869_11_plen_254_part_00
MSPNPAGAQRTTAAGPPAGVGAIAQERTSKKAEDNAAQMRDESAAVTPAAVRKMKAHFDSRLTMGQRVERWLNGGHENAAAVGMVRSYSASADLSFSIEKEEVAPVSPQAGSTATARTRTLYWALGSTDSEHTALRLAQRRLALAFLLCATIDAPEWLLAVNTSGAHLSPIVEKVAAYMSTPSGGLVTPRPRPFDRPAQSGQAGAPPSDALKEFGQMGAGSSGARQGGEAGRTAAGPPQGVQAVTTRTRARSG